MRAKHAGEAGLFGIFFGYLSRIRHRKIGPILSICAPSSLVITGVGIPTEVEESSRLLYDRSSNMRRHDTIWALCVVIAAALIGPGVSFSAYSTPFSSPIGVVGGNKQAEATDDPPSLPQSGRTEAPASTDEFQSFLLSRRTINDFDPTLPSGWEDALTRAVTAATYAPNHKKTEPWRFHLLGPKAIERVCKLNADIVTESKGPAAGEKKLERWLKMPGWLVVTCVRDDDWSMDDPPTGLARENYAAVCCAVQNLCLSLHTDGIGTKWTTGPVNFSPLFGAAAGLPDNEFVVGTIWFGSAARIPEPPKKKLSIEDVLIKHD